MKVALVYPDVPDVFQPYVPVNLAYLASQLEQVGEQVLILDLNLQGDWQKQLLDFNPDFVGLTSVTSSFRRSLQIIDWVKKNLRAKIILGGVHVSLFQEGLLRYPQIDYLFIGEAEHSIREFFISYKNKEPLEQVKGIIYREEGCIIKTPAREFEDNLDSLSFPAWHLVDLLRYDFVSVVTSRGCPYRCIFCAVASIEGHRFRARSAKNVVAEIEYLNQRFGITQFIMAGDCFLVDRKRVLDICQMIKEKGLEINWYVPGARANLVDWELLKSMKEAGCASLAFGIESGSGRILSLIKKNITTSQIEQAVRMAVEAGIVTYGSFMIGNAYETRKTVEETLNFAKRLFLRGGLSPQWSNFNLAVPYPKTELWDWVKENGRFLIKDPIDFPGHIHCENIRPVFETDNLSRRELVRAVKKARRIRQKALYGRRRFWSLERLKRKTKRLDLKKT